ncbi:MAG: pantetheine-phosphate adenylyltransferase [Thermoplasmata archaeon]|jgi:cytidyltransferase-like protein
MRRFRLAVLGGTFDHLHMGHQALLATAFRSGDEVAIGVTSDRFLGNHPKPVPGRLQSYAVRRRALVRWLRVHYPRRKWRVTPLDDPFGGSLEPRVGVLVVSAETERGGRAVNRERRRLGRMPVPIVAVPLVLADDLEPVSSRRIRSGEIGPDGRRRTPIRIAISTSHARDREVAARAIARVFTRARIASGPGPALRTPPSTSPQGTWDLALRISRGTPSGWVAAEQTRKVRLRPRTISGSRPADLQRGLIALLRPQQ